MAEARSKSAWAHTSHVLALVANVNRDPKRRPTPFTAAEFNPHTPRRRGKPSVEGLTRAILAVAAAKRRTPPRAGRS